jgi:enoyl-CoA hydratase/carnithine racemase
MAENLASKPPHVSDVHLSFPAPFILLVTIAREKQMNSIPSPIHWQLDSLFTWYDSEPSLRCAVITGAGEKAFCAGQDLIELGKRGKEAKEGEEWMEEALRRHPPSGFAGISRREGKKPILAAVNGFALGGGMEIVLNW